MDTTAGTLVDALSYEDDGTGMTSVTIPGLVDPVSLIEGTAATASDDGADGSLCRRASNGRDTDDAALDWSFCPVPTPGAANP